MPGKLTVNAALLTLTLYTVTGDGPVLVKLTGKVSDWPVTTLPKATLLGLQTSSRWLANAPGKFNPSNVVATKDRKKTER